MTTSIDASKIVGTNPEESGRKLAHFVMKEFTTLDGVEINVCFCRPGLLISVFFRTFFLEIQDSPELFRQVRRLTWTARYPFQEENIDRWVKMFAPEIAK